MVYVNGFDRKYVGRKAQNFKTKPGAGIFFVKGILPLRTVFFVFWSNLLSWKVIINFLTSVSVSTKGIKYDCSKKRRFVQTRNIVYRESLKISFGSNQF